MGPCTNKNDMLQTTFAMESRQKGKIKKLQSERNWDNDESMSYKPKTYDEEFVDLGDFMDDLPSKGNMFPNPPDAASNRFKDGD